METVTRLVVDQQAAEMLAAAAVVGVFIGGLMRYLTIEIIEGLGRLVGLWYRRKNPAAYEDVKQQPKEQKEPAVA